MTKRRLAFALMLGMATILAACSEQSGGGAGPNGPGGAAEVGVISMKKQAVPLTVEVAGRTSALATAEIRPQVDGIIKSRVFTEGSEVKAGDLLYEIDPGSYQAIYDAAAASLQKAEGALPSAQAKVDRYDQLVGANSVTAQNLDDAKSTLAQAKADVAAAKASVEQAEINLAHTKVTAPIDGLIGTSTVTEGALVTANQTTALATIRQIDPINVDVTDSSVNLLRIRGMMDSGRLKRSDGPPKIRLILEDGSTYDQTGTLESTEASVSQTTGTFSIRSRFANPVHQLLPGMYVRAVIAIGTDENAYLVPQRAVDRNAKGAATAMFVGADNKVETRVLETVQAVGNAWLVTDGIKDGDRLIVDGLQKIREGAAVTAVEVTLDENGLVASAAGGDAPAPTADSAKN
ncbi:efflux transporter periplasmic adaptor subunit [Kaistia algarum]|uniref:efflux RND transporter periplasmic adaptor subunit n=1 Tax=Kaistia algarum TaxID=2083279 RepID=UPI000CE886A8|nr:efflux RND transporter periplasmic adaptor subunit [Kaistia algarum]MCX5513916.1 efflux RND transporter periplasmic adaptor subunit [Kaistia algarum]PPE77548.1 efflux transporter periplasmic adaptor subunit [Kaistia algarum]